MDRDGVTVQVKSTIAMRLPEPNRQELSLAATAAGRFLKLEVAVQLGDGERRGLVRLEEGLLKASLHEENAPAYEDELDATEFDKVEFGSILAAVPLLASGRPAPGRPCELSALLLPLPDLIPLRLRQRFEDAGPEPVVLADGRALEARRIEQVSRLPEGGAVSSTLWAAPDGVPLRQLVEHAGRTVDIVLTFLEERPAPRELPVLRAR